MSTAKAQTKKMNVVQLTILTGINMLGSGIIMLPSQLAKVGTMSILSWLVTAIGATALAYSFAQCGIFSKNKGGMGGYADYTYGKSGNFLANYTYAVCLVISNVAISVSVVGYAVVFVGVKPTSLQTGLLVIATIWISTIPNFISPKMTGKIGSITILGVLIPIIVLCTAGWFFFSGDLWVKSWNPNHYSFLTGISKSITMTLWAFLGLESACANMDAVENPKRDVPIAVLGGTILAAIIYIVSTALIQGINPGSAIINSTAPFGLVFATMFTPLVGKIAIGLMVISCFGSLMAWQFTVAEVFRSSAALNYFPKIFSKVSKNDVPIIGMIILAIFQTIFGLGTISPSINKQFQVLVNLAVVLNMIPYLLSMGALQAMQKIEGASKKKARVTVIISFLAGLYVLYACYASGPEAMLGGGIITFLGWLLYGLQANRFVGKDSQDEGLYTDKVKK